MEAGIGLNEGIVSNSFTLTDAQMKGKACDSPLYENYDTIVDALDAWAYDHNDSWDLQGWTYMEKGYPTLTGLSASAPGSDRTVFTISVNNVEIQALGGDLAVDVKSSDQYSVQIPGWISETSVHGFETDRYMKRHTFRIAYNDSGKSRTGTISFTNSKGTTLSVWISQKTPYLNLDASDIVFSANGGSKKIDVSSSLPWTVSVDSDWCKVSPASGEGDGDISVKALQSEEPDPRTARIFISSTDGSVEYTVMVVQSGYNQQDQADWKKQAFVHKSLAMRFTATWCGWCPRMNKSIRLAQDMYSNKINYVAIHGGGSDLQFGGADALMDQYQIDGFPTGLVDGRAMVDNYDIQYTAQLFVNAVKETELEYGTVTGVGINSSLSGRKTDIDVDVYVKKAGDYKITVLLLEDGIINAQTDYEEGNHPRYVHDNVARMSVSDILGDSFRIDKDFTVKKFSFSADIPSSYNIDNMRVLVYIQRTFDSGHVIQSGSYGNYFIDNSADVALGESLRLALEGGGGGGSGDGNEGIKPGDDIDM